MDKQLKISTMGSNLLTSATIGDINIDYVADISDLDVPLSLELSGQFPRPIQTFVGGNGIFFAEAAQDAGFKSYLFAAVGQDPHLSKIPDIAGREAVERLSNSDVIPILSYISGYPTGRVIILYQPSDRRITIADRGANSYFRGKDIFTFNDQRLEHINLLYISGYYLLEEQQRSAVMDLMKVFRERGTFIMVDVVPHKVYKKTSLNTFREYTTLANGISVEISTMFGFLGIEGDQVGDENKDYVVKVLLDSYEFCLVRVNSRSDFIIADRKTRRDVYIPYFDRVASLRFTDRVLANALYAYLKNNCSVSDNDEWINKANSTISRGTK